jgi:hypothetical protein
MPSKSTGWRARDGQCHSLTNVSKRGRYARNNGQFRSCSARLKAGTLLSFSRPPCGHWSEVAVATSVVAVRDGHWVLLHGRPGVLAWIGRVAAFLCIAVYAVTDYVAGIGTGVVMQQSGHLAIRKSRDRLALRRRQRCRRRGCVRFGVGGGRDCGQHTPTAVANCHHRTPRSSILDGNIVGTSTSRVPNTPMHWVLQCETELNSTYPAPGAVASVADRLCGYVEACAVKRDSNGEAQRRGRDSNRDLEPSQPCLPTPGQS